ncbi:MAG TPA: hypothetical protein HPP58_00695 [Deltaproteobacteria bacterium]|nr:hypothetical protein [Deltaproteobacteria bacterium]HIJ39656.1 hypothetical protein [Deltaproteobacteria bacterium]
MWNSVNALDLGQNAWKRIWATRENSVQRCRTIFLLRKRLLKARKKLAELEKDLDKKQLEFDGLALVNQAKKENIGAFTPLPSKSLTTGKATPAKQKRPPSTSIQAMEYAVARAERAHVALEERLSEEKEISRQFTARYLRFIERKKRRNDFMHKEETQGIFERKALNPWRPAKGEMAAV